MSEKERTYPPVRETDPDATPEMVAKALLKPLKPRPKPAK